MVVECTNTPHDEDDPVRARRLAVHTASRSGVWCSLFARSQSSALGTGARLSVVGDGVSGTPEPRPGTGPVTDRVPVPVPVPAPVPVPVRARVRVVGCRHRSVRVTESRSLVL